MSRGAPKAATVPALDATDRGDQEVREVPHPPGTGVKVIITGAGTRSG
jgi:hypothetical protein